MSIFTISAPYSTGAHSSRLFKVFPPTVLLILLFTCSFLSTSTSSNRCLWTSSFHITTSMFSQPFPMTLSLQYSFLSSLSSFTLVPSAFHIKVSSTYSVLNISPKINTHARFTQAFFSGPIHSILIYRSI